MDIIIYLLKVNVAICVFSLMYRLFYRRDTFFSMRRYLIQGMLMLSALYPLVDFSRWIMHNVAMTDIAMSYKNMLPEIVVYSSGGEVVEAGASYSLMTFFLWFYVAVTCFFLLRTLCGLVRIVWLRLHCEQVMIEGVRVWKLSADMTPFSFFSWVFINPEMHDNREQHEILAHEMVHVRQLHSVDVLIIEIISSLCWINPMVWILKKEIKKNLEFIVDDSVVREDGIDIKSYQYHLLRLARHPSKITLANQFNISPLKERVMMINVKKSPKIRLATYTLVLPMALLFLVANNVGAVADRLSKSGRVASVVGGLSDLVSGVSIEAANVERFVVAGEENAGGSLAGKRADNKKEISGIIMSGKTKGPLAGVNIIVYNTTMGVVSDAHGRFKIFVNEGDTLMFSFVGYSGLTLVARNLPQNLGNIEMSRENVQLDYVLVVSNRNMRGEDYLVRSAENEELVFVAVEKMPEFPDGEKALLKYIAENVNYPVEAVEKGLQGRVSCVFTIKEDGSVGNVRVARGVDPLLDDEAVRVISSLPKFIPGEQRGKKVAVEYSLPVWFRLNNDAPPVAPDSINKNTLVILDGEEVSYEIIHTIDPENIANVSVLKDREAIDQYGEKGENGVILIETKDNNK